MFITRASRAACACASIICICKIIMFVWTCVHARTHGPICLYANKKQKIVHAHAFMEECKNRNLQIACVSKCV